MSTTSTHDDPGTPELAARRRFLKRAGLAAMAGGLLAGAGWMVLKRGANLWQVQHERTLMATSVSITCLAEDREAAAHAIDAACHGGAR